MVTEDGLEDLLKLDASLAPLKQPLSHRDATGMRGAPCLITAMYSEEGERVPFLDAIDPNKGIRRGNVELWMTDVEDAMKASVKDQMSRALAAYSDAGREQWLLEWPGQVVLAANQVLWTNGTEAALRAMSGTAAGGNTAGGSTAAAGTPLQKHLAKVVAQQAALVRMVRGPLTELQRTTVTAVITIEIHARDVIATLVEKNVQSTDAFDWFAQMRYDVCKQGKLLTGIRGAGCARFGVFVLPFCLMYFSCLLWVMGWLFMVDQVLHVVRGRKLLHSLWIGDLWDDAGTTGSLTALQPRFPTLRSRRRKKRVETSASASPDRSASPLSRPSLQGLAASVLQRRR